MCPRAPACWTPCVCPTDQHFPELDLESAPLGIFGKAVPKPAERVLQSGERVEIYRPLIADPKEVRKQRAAKAKAAKTED